MSQAWDKEKKIWVPEGNQACDCLHTGWILNENCPIVFEIFTDYNVKIV